MCYKHRTSCLPHQDELAEPAQFCEMMVTSAVDVAGDPQRRQQQFPALAPGRLAAALGRYRDMDSHMLSMGRHHPRMPQVGTAPCTVSALTVSALMPAPPPPPEAIAHMHTAARGGRHEGSAPRRPHWTTMQHAACA